MSAELEEASPEATAGLGFDPLGLALRLLFRLPLLVILLASSLALAAAGSLQLGSKTYQAETLLLYRPKKGGDDTLSLLTQQNLIKTRPNLEEARLKLGSQENLESFARHFDVRVQRNTDLLSIVAQHGNPKEAARYAETLRQVFLERQDQARKDKIGKVLNDQETRLKQVQGELKKAETNLEAFTLKNRIIDLDKQAQWYLEQLTSLQVLYEQAKVERNSVELQASNIDRIVNELKARIERERKDSPSMANLGDLNIQVQRLRDSVHDDKTQRAGEAILQEKSLAYEQAQVLYKRELISKAELEKAKAAYESQKALTVDTEQIKEWKQKIVDLNALAIPKGPANTASGTILQEMTLKSFDIQLDLVTQDQKVKRLLEAIAASQARLDEIPKLQQRYLALKREVETRAQEKSALEALLSETRRNFQAQQNDFVVAAEAQVPLFPIESNRKKFFLGIALALGGLSTVAIFLNALLDRRIHTVGELSLALEGAHSLMLPADEQSAALPFRARELRRCFPEGRVTLLVTALRSGSGRVSVARALGKAWDEQGERVAWVNLENILDTGGQLPPLSPPKSGRQWELTAAGGPLNGTTAQSSQFQEWLQEIASWADMILLHSPPTDSGVVADLVSHHCQAVLLVVPSSTQTHGAVREVSQRFKAEGVTRVCGLLTRPGRLLRRLVKP